MDRHSWVLIRQLADELRQLFDALLRKGEVRLHRLEVAVHELVDDVSLPGITPTDHGGAQRGDERGERANDGNHQLIWHTAFPYAAGAATPSLAARSETSSSASACENPSSKSVCRN